MPTPDLWKLGLFALALPLLFAGKVYCDLIMPMQGARPAHAGIPLYEKIRWMSAVFARTVFLGPIYLTHCRAWRLLSIWFLVLLASVLFAHLSRFNSGAANSLLMDACAGVLGSNLLLAGYTLFTHAALLNTKAPSSYPEEAPPWR